jgi:glucosamine--fructose-6-phosphate aminotransferase (isomerizing)
MNTKVLGRYFEAEIREQPSVWERIAASDAPAQLARAIDGEVVMIGSGSSLFAAQVGALALRRRGITAHALAATEALADHRAYHGRIVVVVSQSGRSSDVLSALDVLQPERIIALTNTADSPIAVCSDLSIDVRAGVETAIPASKSVSAAIAILLSAASLLGGSHRRTMQMLYATARTVAAWLESGLGEIEAAASCVALRRDVLFLGTDYGAPIARESALKFKEATYMHAEGFEAGEFRHGSMAMVDANSAIIGIMDADALENVGRPLREIERTGAVRYAIGTQTVEGVARIGPMVEDAYNTLAWLATMQMLALHVARKRGVDSDAPRGLTKAIVEP